MSDVAETVGGEVSETVAPGSAETSSHGPTNADILSKLDELTSLITSTVSTATESATESSSETAGEVMEPGNGEVIRDKSPASKPWTHKRVLR